MHGFFNLWTSPLSDRLRAEVIVARHFVQVIRIVPRLQLGKHDGTASSMDSLGADEHGKRLHIRTAGGLMITWMCACAWLVYVGVYVYVDLCMRAYVPGYV